MPTYEGRFSQLGPSKAEPSPRAMARREGEDSLTLGRQKNLEGFSQVTAVSAKLADTSDIGSQVGSQLAGVSPHAPDRRRRERRADPDSLQHRITTRFAPLEYERILYRANMEECDASLIVRRAVRLYLGLPKQEEDAGQRDLKAAVAALLGSWNKLGGLFNQIAAHLNKGLPCPFSRPELDELKARHERMAALTLRHFGLG